MFFVGRVCLRCVCVEKTREELPFYAFADARADDDGGGDDGDGAGGAAAVVDAAFSVVYCVETILSIDLRWMPPKRLTPRLMNSLDLFYPKCFR